MNKIVFFLTYKNLKLVIATIIKIIFLNKIIEKYKD